MMKFVEGFIISKVKRGAKKGQDCIRTSKRYVWLVPYRLENEIELGDEVLAKSTYHDLKTNTYRPRKARVLVVNIYEKDEEPIKRRMVLKILKKNK
ncbi:hypothetical protein QTI73_15545 [Clostridium perfringens]|nr:hypothetical protein [Clostridium perfringens]